MKSQALISCSSREDTSDFCLVHLSGSSNITIKLCNEPSWVKGNQLQVLSLINVWNTDWIWGIGFLKAPTSIIGIPSHLYDNNPIIHSFHLPNNIPFLFLTSCYWNFEKSVEILQIHAAVFFWSLYHFKNTNQS